MSVRAGPVPCGKLAALAVAACLANAGCARGRAIQVPAAGAIQAPIAAGKPYGGIWAVAPKAFSWPLRGEVESRFGELAPDLKNRGIDIGAREGEAVHAAQEGIVSFVSDSVKGYGPMIILDHEDGFQSVYAHNLRNLVVQGQEVQRNQIIAFVGSNARTRRSSLHFEIRREGAPLDPERFLP